MCRGERSGLERPSWRDVVHAACSRDSLRVAAMEIHPVTFNRVMPDRQRVDARQHRTGSEIERIVDRAAESEIGEAGALPPRLEPRLGELVGERLSYVENIEICRVVERG